MWYLLGIWLLMFNNFHFILFLARTISIIAIFLIKKFHFQEILLNMYFINLIFQFHLLLGQFICFKYYFLFNINLILNFHFNLNIKERFIFPISLREIHF